MCRFFPLLPYALLRPCIFQSVLFVFSSHVFVFSSYLRQLYGDYVWWQFFHHRFITMLQYAILLRS